MKPHTLLKTTVPCHFGRDGVHTVTIGMLEDDTLVHLSSDCDNLDPNIREVADGLLDSDEPGDRKKKKNRKRADCCHDFVEQFIKLIGVPGGMPGRTVKDARSLPYHQDHDGIWVRMNELTYVFFRRVSSKLETLRDQADHERTKAKKADIRPEFVRVLEQRFHACTGLTELTVRVATTEDENGTVVPVYPYRGLVLYSACYRGSVAEYRGRGIWIVDEQSDAPEPAAGKSGGLHVEAFRNEIDSRGNGKWTCPCCGSVTSRIEQHCKGNRHRRKFWEAIDNGLEAMNSRLVRENETGEQDR